MSGWLFLGIAVIANIITNFSLRAAVRSLNLTSPYSIILGLIQSPTAWIGGVGAVMLLISFMAAIRVLSLSTSYAILTALAICLIAIIESAVFGETVSAQKLAGLGLAITGVALVATS